MTDDSTARLLYFADPMCSWCWGFSPLIRRLADERPELPLSLIMGGLRAGNTRAIDAGTRDTVLHHWHEVAAASGQPFRFDGALPDGFVYDTEPACRAVVTVRRLAPEQAPAALAAIHHAFYAEGRDVTDTDTLIGTVAGPGLDAERLHAKFEEPATIAETRGDFERSRDHGVSGFPTLLLAHGDRKRIVSIGYSPWDTLIDRLDRTLQRDA